MENTTQSLHPLLQFRRYCHQSAAAQFNFWINSANKSVFLQIDHHRVNVRSSMPALGWTVPPWLCESWNRHFALGRTRMPLQLIQPKFYKGIFGTQFWRGIYEQTSAYSTSERFKQNSRQFYIPWVQWWLPGSSESTWGDQRASWPSLRSSSSLVPPPSVSLALPPLELLVHQTFFKLVSEIVENKISQNTHFWTLSTRCSTKLNGTFQTTRQYKGERADLVEAATIWRRCSDISIYVAPSFVFTGRFQTNITNRWLKNIWTRVTLACQELIYLSADMLILTQNHPLSLQIHLKADYMRLLASTSLELCKLCNCV